MCKTCKTLPIAHACLPFSISCIKRKLTLHPHASSTCVSFCSLRTCLIYLLISLVSNELL